MTKENLDFKFEVAFVQCDDTIEEQNERMDRLIDSFTDILIEQWSLRKKSEGDTSG